MVVIIMRVAMIMIMRVFMIVVVMVVMVMMVGIAGMVFVAMGVDMRFFAVIMVMGLMIVRLVRRRVIRACPLNDSALDAVAIAAAARVAVARTAAVGAILGFLFGLAMGAFVRLDQRLTIGDRYLIIIGMNFAEGQEAMAIATIFDEGGLQRRFDPRDLGEINIAAQLFALRGLEIKFFDAVAADDDDPGLLRVGGIDKHLVLFHGL